MVIEAYSICSIFTQIEVGSLSWKCSWLNIKYVKNLRSIEYTKIFNKILKIQSLIYSAVCNKTKETGIPALEPFGHCNILIFLPGSETISPVARISFLWVPCAWFHLPDSHLHREQKQKKIVFFYQANSYSGK